MRVLEVLADGSGGVAEVPDVTVTSLGTVILRVWASGTPCIVVLSFRYGSK